MKTILLTGVGSPASQNFLACLRMGPADYRIIGCDLNRYHLEWGDLDGRYQAPRTHSPEYLPFLEALIDREGVDFVHGQPDMEVAFLSKHATMLKARTFYPDPFVVFVSQNKWASIARWQNAGLREHASAYLIRHAEGMPVMPCRGRWPAWIRACAGAGARGACLVQDWEHADQWMRLQERSGALWDWILEDHLPGPEYSWHSLWWEGRLICSQGREYIEKPTAQQMGEAGVSSSYIVAKTVSNPDLNRIGEASVLALDPKPHGTYGMDLRADVDGVIRPTECNAGRFKTTSLMLARAGCNMPFWFVRLGLGDDPDVVAYMTRTYDACDPGMLYIRHMDCEPALVPENALRSIPYGEA